MTGRKKELPGANAPAGLRKPCSTDRNRTPAALVRVRRPGPPEVDEGVVVDLVDGGGHRVGVVGRAEVPDARPDEADDVDVAQLVGDEPAPVPVDDVARVVRHHLQQPGGFLG